MCLIKGSYGTYFRTMEHFPSRELYGKGNGKAAVKQAAAVLVRIVAVAVRRAAFAGAEQSCSPWCAGLGAFDWYGWVVL